MPSLITLLTFNGTNGANPFGSLIADANGDLFGTTEGGGASGHGTVFEIGGVASTPATLVSFGSPYGINPYGSLLADSNGNLFGTTYSGGASGVGTVFEIAKTAGGYASTPTTLLSFTYDDGAFPYGSLIADAGGNLFGTTYDGGASGSGTVFEIAKTNNGYASTPTTLVTFDNANGANPHGSLLADAQGSLFGTTLAGGASGAGTVFEIVKTAGGYDPTPVTLVSFNSTDGANPQDSLIADANGDLFGTTFSGGAGGLGTVFEIVKTAGGYASTPTTLVDFNFTDGAFPDGSLIADADGNLFGTTADGGAIGYGTVFEIAKTSTGYASTPTLLVSFDSINGADPQGSLFADASGDLFGTTGFGGASGDGTVFEITDSGYVPCFTVGSRIMTDAGEVTVEALRVGDMVATQWNHEIVFRPVKWIGHRRIDLLAHPRPDNVAPVRIQRGAFAGDLPRRDLLVSPDHAIFCDGKLICARQLINGATIRQEQGLSAVAYFHVELEAHAILLAEGLPTESYLDTGNRGLFANSKEPLLLYPNMIDGSGHASRELASCAPFVSDEAGVRPVWKVLAERAALLGLAMPSMQTAADPDVCIIAEGRSLRPLSRENGLYRFVLPRNGTAVRLVSRSAAPTDLRPWAEDRRRLGIYVERIVLRCGNELRELPVDHPDLVQGWWAAEGAGMTLRRWTNGDAILPLPMTAGPVILEIWASSGGMAYLTPGDEGRQAA